jgi:ParB family transcriptional regulator, chromosome partitioning protein
MMAGRGLRKREELGRSVLELVSGGKGNEAVAAEVSPGIVGSALALHREALAEKVARLEADLEVERTHSDRLLRLDPALVVDCLPPDRDERAFQDKAYAVLKASIAAHGQHVPIVVRAAPGRPECYEIAAGRRRLAVCRDLGREVLARVLSLDDDAMLALQYRENAEREDVSTFERGRWFARLATERGLSTTALAALAGLAQSVIVELVGLARLPEGLLALLQDPRELSLADGRRLRAALRTEGGLDRMLAALRRSPAGVGTKAQVGLALRAAMAAAEREVAARCPKGRHILAADGRRLGFLTRSGEQWVCRFDRTVEAEAVDWLADQIPGLLERWRQE